MACLQVLHILREASAMSVLSVMGFSRASDSENRHEVWLSRFCFIFLPLRELQAVLTNLSHYYEEISSFSDGSRSDLSIGAPRPGFQLYLYGQGGKVHGRRRIRANM